MSTMIDHARAEAAIGYTCQAFGVSKQQLLSRDRREIVAVARQVAMTLAWRNTGLTADEVGHIFGRCRANVEHAARKVAKRAATCTKTVGAIIDALERKVKNETFG